MLVDARRLPPDHVVRCDVCVVGAGAAGITLARALGADGRTVCLLESGGLEPDADTDALNEGEGVGPILTRYPAYLAASRQRVFGGATNHWTGWCRPLDPIDFEPRPWVPDSGWPLSRRDLDPYYRQAAEVVQIEPFDDGLDEGRDWPSGSTILSTSVVRTKRYRLSPPTRFGELYRETLARAPDTTVYLYANVTEIDVVEAGTHVRRLRVATLDGTAFSVEARVYVLATGGIENPRLLLNSRRVQTQGLGNRHDLVGRYFMEHPHDRAAGRVVLTAAIPRFAHYEAHRVADRADRAMAVLCLSDDAQRRHRVLNASIQIDEAQPRSRFPIVHRIGQALHQVARFSGATDRGGPRYARCFVRAEQRPHRDSRVSLVDERDALGLQKVRLAWHLTDLDSESVRTTLALIAMELGREGRGRGAVTMTAGNPWSRGFGGSHHLGTTRMADAPTRGVVDPDCRVHGMTNLYVAGSSVFPTGGHANPTLTIVALALRLADHLAWRLAGDNA